MNPRIPNYLKLIFENSVQDSLISYGINPGSNQKANFLFSAVLTRVETEWVISGKIQTDIHYDPVTGSYDSLILKKLIADYVKQEVLEETRNLQIDAERKILEATIDGKYFKKEGGKKLLEDAMAVISPASKDINNLLGTKIKSTSAESYRKAVLDVAHPEAKRSLQSAVEEVRKIQGKDKTPPADMKVGQKLSSALVDTIDYKIDKGQMDSPHLSEVLKIKKDYESATKTLRDERQDLVAQRNSLIGNSPTVAAERARLNAEISNREAAITGIRTGAVGGVAGAGRNYEAEIINAQIVGNNNFSLNLGASYTTTAAVGVAPTSMIGATGITSGVPLFMQDSKSVLMSVWEKDPEARVKIEELTAKLAVARTPAMQNFYQNQINSYTRKLTDRVSGRTADVFGFEFNDDGTLTIDDRVQKLHDRALKNLSRSFAYPNISKALNEYRVVDAAVKVTYLEDLSLKLPSPAAVIPEIHSLIDMHNTYAQALKLASTLPRSTSMSAAELALLNQDKASFIANISNIISDPTEQAKVLGYLNSGDHVNFGVYFASGFGNKNAETIRTQMNERLIALATNDLVRANCPEFTRAVMDKALTDELIKSQVFRRYTENVIMAAQLMTDPAYLKREIKRTLQKEVITAIGNKYVLPNLRVRFGDNQALGDSFDAVVGALSDPEFRKDPAKYIKAHLVKGAKGFAGDYLNNKFKDRRKIKVYGQNVDFDFKTLISDPRKYATSLFKDRLMLFINDFAYKQLVPRFRLIRTLYLRLKNYLWKGTEFLKSAGMALLQRIAPSLAARFAAMIAGIAVPGVGWLVTTVLAVIPVILKPFVGEDVTIGDLLKKALKVIFFGPCLVLVFIWVMVLIPIVSLFANFWSTLWSTVTGEFDNWADRVLGKTAGSNFGVYGTYDLGYNLIDGLVTTSGNKCIDENHNSKFAQIRKHPTGWNNLKPDDFTNLQNATELNCKIICNARSELATLYPGIGGMLNCSSTRNEIFNPSLPDGSASQRFWCTHTIMKSWGATPEFSILDNDIFAGVRSLKGALAADAALGPLAKVDQFILNNIGTVFSPIINSSWYPAQEIARVQPVSTCFSKEQISSGAVLVMSQDPTCNLVDGNHVAMILKFEGNEMVYMNSNSGLLKEKVAFQDCPGSPGMIQLKTKDYTLADGSRLRFYMCNIFQPKDGLSPTVTTCPVCPVPSINNY